MTISEGKTVSFDYTLTVDGETVDTSKGKEPLKYVQGDSNLIPGLTKRMEGMQTGDEKKIEVPAEEAYGQVREEAFKDVPKKQLPPDMEPARGMVLQVQQPGGPPMPVRIKEVKPDSVVIDFNHPLAGKDLMFDVKIVSVE